MDQQPPTNVQILEMLREQQTRVDEQQHRLAQQEARTAQLEAENAELRARAERVEVKVEQRLEQPSLAPKLSEVEEGPVPQNKTLSRAGLFKAAAMGSAAVVGAGALGTLGAEHAAAATFDTNFIANGFGTNFDAKGSAPVGVDTGSGSFATGGNFVGNGTGAAGYGPTALYGRGGRYGAQLESSAGVPLYLVPGGAVGSPTTGTHNRGEFYVDSIGRVYHCTIAGTPGNWVPLNALVPITPVRVLDTRSGTQVGTSTGPFATGSTLTFGISAQTFATSSGTFTFPNFIVGVVGNLVAVTPTGAGYLIAYPQGATLPTAASVNFVPPGTGSDIYYSLGNHVTVALSDTGQMSIYMGLVPGANVQVVLDIAGYLV